MLQKCTRQHQWGTYLILVCLLVLAACQASEPEIEAVLPLTTPATRFTATATADLVPNWTRTPMPLVTATMMPLPSITSAPLPTVLPTAAPIQKMGELPIAGNLISMSADNTLLAVVNRGTGMVYGFDLSTEEIKWQFSFQDHLQNLTSFDISPDGKYLAFGGAVSPNGIAAQGMFENVFVLDIEVGEWVHTILVPYEVIDSLSFSSDNRYLAASTDFEIYPSGYGITVWEVATGQLAYQFPSDDYHWEVLDAVFVPYRPDLLVMATTNLVMLEGNGDGEKAGGLYLWNIDSQELQEGITGGWGEIVAASPNGRLIAAYIDGKIWVWDIERGAEIISVSMEEIANRDALALANSGVIAGLNTEGILTLWNLQGKLLGELKTDGHIGSMTFLSNEELLITSYMGSEAQPIEVWQIRE
jgi:WD40 repeat protein